MRANPKRELLPPDWRKPSDSQPATHSLRTWEPRWRPVSQPEYCPPPLQPKLLPSQALPVRMRLPVQKAAAWLRPLPQAPADARR